MTYKGKKLIEKIVDDPITGGSASAYTSDDGTFSMWIPHQATQLTQEQADAFRANLGTITQTGPKTWTWEANKKD